MDTIVAKGRKSAILTIVERSTNMCFIQKIKNGFSPEDTARAAISLLLPYRDYVRSITTDNGLEFRAHHLISMVLKAPVFFADPYASWQKGSIENTNKLIRQYIPKDSDFNDLSCDDISQIQQRLNRRPRAKLLYDAPFVRFKLFFPPVAFRH